MSTTTVSRRRLLFGAGAGTLALAGMARAAMADEAATNEMITKLVGTTKAVEDKISIKLPQIAENGNTVPFTVTVDSPMTDADYVKTIHVLAEGNPSPGVASFTFTPDSGKAEVSMRLRLARTQNVKAYAVTSQGQIYSCSREVKVTIGGCGG